MSGSRLNSATRLARNGFASWQAPHELRAYTTRVSGADRYSASGRSMDEDTRSFMESRFNYDFSNVKIHDNELAAKSASSINALAYTSGNNIVFNSEQYNPGSDSGKRLLAHELTHVAQQNSGADSMLQRLEGPCEDIPQTLPHPFLIRQSVHPAVREAQVKLNLFHDQQIAAGKPGLTDAPLVEDCIFGQHTFNAVVSFQEQVFPAQPEFHTGNIGEHTWAELDKITGAPTMTPPITTAPPPTDQEVMDNAKLFSRSTIRTAIGSLSSLELSIQFGLMPFGVEAIHERTINALNTWLKVKPGDANFLSTIQIAKRKMGDNLAVTTRIVRQAQSHPDCSGNPFAVTNENRPDLNIRCCDDFFKKSPSCQSDVLTHEYFHLVGLSHQAATRATITTDDALKDNDQMSQFISEIATGNTDACIK